MTTRPAAPPLDAATLARMHALEAQADALAREAFALRRGLGMPGQQGTVWEHLAAAEKENLRLRALLAEQAPDRAGALRELAHLRAKCAELQTQLALSGQRIAHRDRLLHERNAVLRAQGYIHLNGYSGRLYRDADAPAPPVTRDVVTWAITSVRRLVCWYVAYVAQPAGRDERDLYDAFLTGRDPRTPTSALAGAIELQERLVQAEAARDAALARLAALEGTGPR